MKKIKIIKITCKCECHTQSWNQKTHHGYYVDVCNCVSKPQQSKVKLAPCYVCGQGKGHNKASHAANSKPQPLQGKQSKLPEESRIYVKVTEESWRGVGQMLNELIENQNALIRYLKEREK